jgi:hypothetical protein
MSSKLGEATLSEKEGISNDAIITAFNKALEDEEGGTLTQADLEALS